MLIDASALVTVIVDGPRAHDFAACMALSSRRLTTAISQSQAAIGLGRFFNLDFAFGQSQVKDFIERAEIDVIDFSKDIVDDALIAFGRYGKDTGHSAALTMFDCFNYAMARRLDVPLLSRHERFSRTDVKVAV